MGCARIALGDAERAQAPETRASSPTNAIALRTLIKFQHRHERLLWNLDRTDPLHPSLAFLLLFQQLAFTRDVAAVALGKHVFPYRRNRLAGNHLAADRCLQRHLEHLTRDDRLQLLDKFAALNLRLAAMRDERQSVDWFARDQDVELDQVAFAKTDHLVVHRRVALGT